MDQGDSGFEDQVVQCRDCGQEFVFTAGEQAFFQQKGFLAPPKRCKSCRDRKKALGDSGGGGGGGPPPRSRGSSQVEVMERPARTFRPRDNGGGGGGGGRDRGPRQGGGPRQATAITCAQCGAQTTVPFEPAPDRPVYCRDCYQTARR